jgi:hypothetical protein
MGKHIITYGFVANYTQWICHGEAHRARDEVLRQHIKDFDDEVGCGDMLEDFHQANFASSRVLSYKAHSNGTLPCKKLPCALCCAHRRKTHDKDFAMRFLAFVMRLWCTANRLFPVVYSSVGKVLDSVLGLTFFWIYSWI